MEPSYFLSASFTLREHDDAAAFRDGKLLELHTRLEVRHLSPGAILLTSQRSPIHQDAFDQEREALLKKVAAGATTVDDFVKRILQLRDKRV